MFAAHTVRGSRGSVMGGGLPETIPRQCTELFISAVVQEAEAIREGH